MENNALNEFEDRVNTEWLESFCFAEHRNYSTQGFKHESLKNLDEHDAFWFLKSMNTGIATESDGFFYTPLSKAKEQIFWEGAKKVQPRPITLWIEPIITIGALAKLRETYKWPIERLGAQSKTWAFDLVGYGENLEDEVLACEVKKSTKEIDTLIDLMHSYSSQELNEDILNAKEKNAYRKVVGIRRSWPAVFWALGPNGYSKVYEIHRVGEHEFKLIEKDETLLKYN